MLCFYFVFTVFTTVGFGASQGAGGNKKSAEGLGMGGGLTTAGRGRGQERGSLGSLVKMRGGCEALPPTPPSTRGRRRWTGKAPAPVCLYVMCEWGWGWKRGGVGRVGKSNRNCASSVHNTCASRVHNTCAQRAKKG
jgi:hypothetical protein